MNDTFPINIENFLKVIIMAVWTAIMFLYRYFTGIELGRGMPKVTWVARGLMIMAKGRYTVPYYYLLIPYAVMGWQQLIRGKNNGKTS